jgi:hypothetical protein
MLRTMRALRALLLTLAPLFASAQTPLPPDDARAVRDVVEAQIDAFQRDDAVRAFSYASAGIHSVFGTPENFMHMVRNSYAVVYRPQTVRFETAVMMEGVVIQPVRLTDAEGRAWLAVYSLLRAQDGAWRIDGCSLGRLAGRET